MTKGGRLVSDQGMMDFDLSGTVSTITDGDTPKERNWKYVDEKHIVIDDADTLVVEKWTDDAIKLTHSGEGISISLKRSKQKIEKYNS